MKIAKIGALVALSFSSLSAQAYSISKYLGNDGRFDKPVVLVEGYDPNNALSAASYYGRIPQALKTFLKSSDRDLVIVNFNSGGASIEANANELINALKQINNEKVGSHPNAIIGYSMGGLVARYALKTMENQNQDHETSLYISYDAPHRGANIPHDIKEDFDRLYSKIDKYGSVPTALKQARNGFYSAAAKQMLMWGENAESFYRKMDSLGYPEELARIALSNGTASGIQQGLANNTLLFDYKYEIAQIRSYDDALYTNDKIPCSYPCNPTFYTHVDNAPGGQANYFKQYADEIINADKSTSGSVFDLDVHLNDTANANHAFVPTLSALDIRNFSWSQSITQQMLNESPFDEVYTLGANLSHAALYHVGNIQNALERFHKLGADIPSRSHKVKPLEDLTSARAEWVNRGINLLNWSSVPGATHYEIFNQGTSGREFVSSGIKVTGTSFSFNTSKNQTIAIRACRSGSCSYPVTKSVIVRDGSILPL